MDQEIGPTNPSVSSVLEQVGLRIGLLARDEPKFLNKKHIKNLNLHFVTKGP